MRTTRPIALMLIAALVVVPLGGCMGNVHTTAMPTPGPKMAAPVTIRLGSLPTEDILPLWAAQQQGIFDKIGVSVQVVPFSSASSRDTAFRSGAIDGFMGDIVTVAKLRDEGFKNRIVTICLGTGPAQGRFGLVASPGSRLRFTSQLASVAIATSSDTMEEYVLDGLMHSRERSAAVRKQYVEKASERFDLLTRGKVKAALLPEPYLSLAIRRRAHLIVDDTKGANLSQTVLAFSDQFLAKPGGASAVNRLLGAWDAGSSAVNSHHKIYRPLLAEKAAFPSALGKRYRMNGYPDHGLPDEQEVSSVLAWMKDKKLLHAMPAYSDLTWTP